MEQRIEHRSPHIAVIGAGAAGLVAAYTAAQTGAPVSLLERTSDGGRKILISGGGRCNVLPSRLSTKEYVTGSDPKILRKILRSWPLAKQRLFFEEELGIRLLLEEETGKLFPEGNRARDVRDRLVEAGRDRGVAFRFNTEVTGLGRAGDRWQIETAGGSEILADRVILSTGGLSVPKTGSDGFGLRLAERLGHAITPLYPALTPLLSRPPVHGDLAGLSLDLHLDARSEGERRSTEGGFLFTHRGYSGPTVLDLSDIPVRAAAEGRKARLAVRWTDRGEEEWRKLFLDGGRTHLVTILRDHLPSRLAEMLLGESGLSSEVTCAELKREDRERLIRSLVDYELPIDGDEGYKKAEVTGGGVRLEEIDHLTMESRHTPGLFLCGEMLDAFGPIGGYNFLWAWVTGRAAGLGAAERHG